MGCCWREGSSEREEGVVSGTEEWEEEEQIEEVKGMLDNGALDTGNGLGGIGRRRKSKKAGVIHSDQILGSNSEMEWLRVYRHQ